MKNFYDKMSYAERARFFFGVSVLPAALVVLSGFYTELALPVVFKAVLVATFVGFGAAGVGNQNISRREKNAELLNDIDAIGSELSNKLNQNLRQKFKPTQSPETAQNIAGALAPKQSI